MRTPTWTWTGPSSACDRFVITILYNIIICQHTCEASGCAASGVGREGASSTKHVGALRHAGVARAIAADLLLTSLDASHGGCLRTPTWAGTGPVSACDSRYCITMLEHQQGAPHMSKLQLV
jgi:hypothetical protein